MFKMTTEKANEIIAEYMYHAYCHFGDDVNLVACEILFEASKQLKHGVFANPYNHQLIMNILQDAGGVKAHQAKYPFVMNIGSK